MDSLRVQVTHGQTKHDITVTPPAGAAGLTLSHLAKEVARVTEVPVKNQKLISKGKTLADQFASLRSLGIKNNSKLMLLGKKENRTEDLNMSAMAKVEAEVAKVEQRLGGLSEEVDGITKGFLSADRVAEALKKLALQVGSCSEEFTRALERLDALTLAEASPEVRQRRKSLVQRIQGSLDMCDRVRSQIKEEQSRR